MEDLPRNVPAPQPATLSFPTQPLVPEVSLLFDVDSLSSSSLQDSGSHSLKKPVVKHSPPPLPSGMAPRTTHGSVAASVTLQAKGAFSPASVGQQVEPWKEGGKNRNAAFSYNVEKQFYSDKQHSQRNSHSTSACKISGSLEKGTHHNGSSCIKVQNILTRTPTVPLMTSAPGLIELADTATLKSKSYSTPATFEQGLLFSRQSDVVVRHKQGTRSDSIQQASPCTNLITAAGPSVVGHVSQPSPLSRLHSYSTEHFPDSRAIPEKVTEYHSEPKLYPAGYSPNGRQALASQPLPGSTGCSERQFIDASSSKGHGPLPGVLYNDGSESTVSGKKSRHIQGAGSSKSKENENPCDRLQHLYNSPVEIKASVTSSQALSAQTYVSPSQAYTPTTQIQAHLHLQTQSLQVQTPSSQAQASSSQVQTSSSQVQTSSSQVQTSSPQVQTSPPQVCPSVSLCTPPAQMNTHPSQANSRLEGSYNSPDVYELLSNQNKHLLQLQKQIEKLLQIQPSLISTPEKNSSVCQCHERNINPANDSVDEGTQTSTPSSPRAGFRNKVSDPSEMKESVSVGVMTSLVWPEVQRAMEMIRNAPAQMQDDKEKSGEGVRNTVSAENWSLGNIANYQEESGQPGRASVDHQMLVPPRSPLGNKASMKSVETEDVDDASLTLSLKDVVIQTFHEPVDSPVSSLHIDMPEYHGSFGSFSHENQNAAAAEEDDFPSPVLGESVSLNEDEIRCQGSQTSCSSQERNSESWNGSELSRTADNKTPDSSNHGRNQGGAYERRTEGESWTFYQNFLGEVQKFLNNSPVCSQEGIQPEGMCLQPHNIQNKTSEGSPVVSSGQLRSTNTDSAGSVKSVREATKKQIKGLGVSFLEPERNSGEVEVERDDFNTMYLPKLNYFSLHQESDSDFSMEVNTLAMKYLKDEQLTEVARLASGKASKVGKTNSTLLHHVLNQGRGRTEQTDVTMYGMSGNNLSFATKKYMEKYGLLPPDEDFPIVQGNNQYSFATRNFLQKYGLFGNEMEYHEPYTPPVNTKCSNSFPTNSCLLSRTPVSQAARNTGKKLLITQREDSLQQHGRTEEGPQEEHVGENSVCHTCQQSCNTNRLPSH